MQILFMLTLIKKRSKIISNSKKIEFFLMVIPGVKKLENFIRITTGPKKEMSKLVKIIKILLINF